MDLLDNVIQPYAWGSRTAIARLQGRPHPTSEPEAELWMGAHPSAPSRIARTGQSLLHKVEAAPAQVLGDANLARFGARLPFLFKVLAAQTPLSLQAHPSTEQAQEGFARENAAAIPLGASHRNYKDPHHKPEILCALEPFWALCGFREPSQTVRLLESLQVPSLEVVLGPLREGQRGLRAACETLMTLPAAQREPLVANVVRACGEAAGASEFVEEKRWARALGELYPGDAGVVGALLLNVLRLEAGEAIYLPAGNLHAYLQGAGVELMASSDNVLRGGCTPKHVDVPELLRVLDFRPMTPEVLRPLEGAKGLWRYATPAPDFTLWRARAQSEHPVPFEGGVPQIALCVEGKLQLSAQAGEPIALRAGQSAFVAASDGAWRMEGDGTAFLASPGA